MKTHHRRPALRPVGRNLHRACTNLGTGSRAQSGSVIRERCPCHQREGHYNTPTFAREMTRISPTSPQYLHGGGVFSVAMCAEMKFSRHVTVACGIVLFGRPLASECYSAYSPATGGAMYTRLPCLPRVATPDPQLAVVCFRREVQMASTVRAHNNYFVTIFQRGGWSLVSAKSAAEMDCSSEMASYRCNP
jgi:hypothetical protein